MIKFFPQKIANRGITLFFLSFAIVSILYFRYILPFKFTLIGIFWIILFFVAAPNCSKNWENLYPDKFKQRLFFSALAIRLIWMTFAYFFYLSNTGKPFEWATGDAEAYHIGATWYSTMPIGNIWKLASSRGISDGGYVFYLGCLYKIIGPNIYLARVVKCILSAFTCVLIYKLGARNIGEKGGRMAAVFCCFMPNLIYYCALHVKEVEMMFIEVLFLESSDFLLKSKKLTLSMFITPIICVLTLFTFRTALAAVSLLSFGTAILCSKSSTIGKGKKVLIIVWAAINIVILAGSSMKTEIDAIWEGRNENQISRRELQVSRGYNWAKYATGTVMMPFAFALPFATMVDASQQYNQYVIFGGNFVKNFMFFFIIIALIEALFTQKNWRELSLVGAFTIGYLIVIMFSAFSNSERFLVPAVPPMTIMWAYGMQNLDKKYYKWIGVWSIMVILFEVGWAYFKLGSRGLF